jgi:hypothetical protein
MRCEGGVCGCCLQGPKSWRDQRRKNMHTQLLGFCLAYEVDLVDFGFFTATSRRTCTICIAILLDVVEFIIDPLIKLSICFDLHVKENERIATTQIQDVQGKAPPKSVEPFTPY